MLYTGGSRSCIFFEEIKMGLIRPSSSKVVELLTVYAQSSLFAAQEHKLCVRSEYYRNMMKRSFFLFFKVSHTETALKFHQHTKIFHSSSA